MDARDRTSFSGNERFEILEKLGSGGMGVVYRAFDRHRQEKVALKTLHEVEPSALLRLKNEFRALQDLQHPNLVTLGELFNDGGHWFFTMELVQGVDVISHVRSGVAGPDAVDEEELRSCLTQLAEGLAVIHAAGRVHRDIKPGNILVDQGGRLVLLDFGLVLMVEPGQLSTEHFFPVGTVAYMSPEQAASKPVTAAADWYGVGVLLYEALTGRLPFEGSATKVLLDKQVSLPKRPSELVASVASDLDDLCVALLNPDPHRRPQAAEVLAVAGPPKPDASRRSWPGSVQSGSTVFVGRDRELAVMSEALGAVVQGKAATVLVHGVSGLGKSELLRTFTRRLIDGPREVLVLSGRCYERESVPYKAFDGVVDALSLQLQHKPATELAGVIPDNASLLMRLFPVLGRVESFREAAPKRFVVEDLQEVRNLAFQALQELFSRLADRHLVVVTVDDLQWADEDSKRLLRSLMQPPREPRMLLLASVRTPSEGEEAKRTLDSTLEAFPEPPRVLALEPLSPEESRELARALAGPQPEAEDTRARIEEIARETAGHPLFIRELVQHARALPSDAEAGPVLRLDDALWGRISDLDTASKRLVEAVAVAGSPVAQGVVAAAAQLEEAEMFKLTGRLRAERLVRTGGPSAGDTIEAYHDRVREAVLARLGRDKQQSWHGRLADAMIGAEGVEPEWLAVHLQGAGRPVEAAAYAARAAERAAESLAFRRAVELYRRALESWPEPRSDDEREEVRKLRVRLGEALGNAGLGAESAQAYRSAVAGASHGEALELKRRGVEQLLRSGHVEDGLSAVQELLGTLGMRLPRSTFGSMIGLLWQRLRLRLRGLGFRLQDRNRIPPDAIITADVCNAMSQGLAMADPIRGAYFSTRFVSLALRLGERSRVARALWMEASYAANTGLPAPYVKRLHDGLASLVVPGDPTARAYLDCALGCAGFMDGRWSQALRLFENADEVFNARGGSVWERTTFRFFVFWSLFYLGELRELTRRVTPLYTDAMERGDRYAASGMFLGLCNAAHLNALGAEETRRRIREITDAWPTGRYYLRNYYALLAETQVDLYDGRGHEGWERVSGDWRALKMSFLLTVPSVRIEANHLRARAALAAAEGGEDARDEALADARRHVRQLSKERAAWARALAGPLRAALAVQSGDQAGGARLLAQGVEHLDREELKLYAAAARFRLGQLAGGDEGRDHVDQARRFFDEQQVADPDRMLAMLVPGFSRIR